MGSLFKKTVASPLPQNVGVITRRGTSSVGCLMRNIESCGSLIEATFHRLSPCPPIAGYPVSRIVPPHEGQGLQRDQRPSVRTREPPFPAMPGHSRAVLTPAALKGHGWSFPLRRRSKISCPMHRRDSSRKAENPGKKRVYSEKEATYF